MKFAYGFRLETERRWYYAILRRCSRIFLFKSTVDRSLARSANSNFRSFSTNHNSPC